MYSLCTHASYAAWKPTGTPILPPRALIALTSAISPDLKPLPLSFAFKRFTSTSASPTRTQLTIRSLSGRACTSARGRSFRRWPTGSCWRCWGRLSFNVAGDVCGAYVLEDDVTNTLLVDPPARVRGNLEVELGHDVGVRRARNSDTSIVQPVNDV